MSPKNAPSAKDSPTTLAQLNAALFFRGVDHSVLESIALSTKRIELVEGDFLWRAGDQAYSFIVIQRGLVQIARNAASGDRSILGIFGPRQSVGDFAVMRKSPYPADAIVISEKLKALSVPADLVMNAMQTNLSMAHAVQQSMVQHSEILRAKIDIMSAGSVPARLAQLLLHLKERFGDETDEGEVHIPIRLSRTALSQLVAARIETVIRIMSDWQKKGVLTSSPEGFIVHDERMLRNAFAMPEGE